MLYLWSTCRRAKHGKNRYSRVRSIYCYNQTMLNIGLMISNVSPNRLSSSTIQMGISEDLGALFDCFFFLRQMRLKTQKCYQRSMRTWARPTEFHPLYSNPECSVIFVSTNLCNRACSVSIQFFSALWMTNDHRNISVLTIDVYN